MQSNRVLTRISEKVFNRPLLITEVALEPIASYLKSPNRTFNVVNQEISEQEKLLQEFDFEKRIDSYEEEQLKGMKQRAGINPDTNIGIIDVSGTLVAKAGQVNGCVELTSYEKLKKLTALQIKLGAKSIVYNIDSGGGEAYTAFTSARQLRKMADDAGIKTFAYVDGCACSGAYMMASAAHEIVSNEDSDVGSIGVLVQLVNPSKHLEKEGFERTFITAGDNKVPFDQDGSFKPEFIERIQKGVNETYVKFVDAVNDLRPSIGRENIIATQASVYDAKEALNLGLIDKIMEWEDFEKYVNTSSTTQTVSTSSTYTQIKTEGNMQEQITELEGLQAQVSDLTTQLEEKSVAYDALLSEKVELEKHIQTLTQANETLSTQLANKEKEVITSARKAKLEEVLGKDNEKIEDLLTSTEKLEESAFDVIVSTLGVNVDMQAQAHEEVGDEGQEAEVQLSLAEALAERAKSQK